MARRDGFSVIEAVLIVGVIVVLGAVGYLAYTNLFKAPATTDSVAEKTMVEEPVKVESTADLDKATAALDDVSLDDSELDQLDNELKGF